MKTAIRYFTKSKKENTVKLANAVSEALGVEALTVEQPLNEEVEILFLVNAMYANNIDKAIKAFLEENASKIKLLVNVNSSASGKSTLEAVSKVAFKYGIQVADKEFHCRGSFLFLGKGLPNDKDLENLKAFAKNYVEGEDRHTVYNFASHKDMDFDSLSYDELSVISRDDHQEDVRQYDKQQNALCLVVLGGICLISAILFLILSFKRVKNKMGGIDALSLQFFVSIACFVAAALLLTFGLMRFIKAHKVRKNLHNEIIEISNKKKALISRE